jgi:OmpA-OmpF porin, OOP family
VREDVVIGKIFGGVLCAVAAAVPATAQTMSYADAIDQLASACRNDIAKFCKGVPLGPHLKECFDANQARMSPQCQQTRGIVYASISRRAAAQRNMGDVCSADIARMCGTSYADAHLVECLLSVSPTAISPQCNQTFTDTGWRTERARQ